MVLATTEDRPPSRAAAEEHEGMDLAELTLCVDLLDTTALRRPGSENQVWPSIAGQTAYMHNEATESHACKEVTPAAAIEVHKDTAEDTCTQCNAACKKHAIAHGRG